MLSVTILLLMSGGCKKQTSATYCYRLYNWDSRYAVNNPHDTINTFDSTGIFCFVSYQGDTIQRSAGHTYTIVNTQNGTYYSKDSNFEVYIH